MELVRDRRAERYAATRDEIVAAAWALAAEHGLAGLSLRDAATAVGLRAPSLYSYFASKNDIYDAMFAEGYRDLAARFVDLPETADAEADFRRGSRVFVDFCTESAPRYQLLFQRTIPGFAPSEESYAIARDVLETTRRHLARLGLTEQAHLDLYTAVTTGLVDQQMSNDPGGDRWTRLLDDAIDMLLAHVRRPRRERKTR